MALNLPDPPEETGTEPVFVAATRTAIGIQLARAKLNVPPPLQPFWPVLAAAALAAASALSLSLAVIIGLPKLG